MQKILIVVDMQNDFVTGSLGSEAVQMAAKNIAAHINEYDTVIFTRDTHGPDYLDTLEGKFLPVPHCIKDTEGWEIIPELVNSKGYRVLDPHIKAIYGDSITPQRCARIYQRLENNGFAINNVSLGVGSFSFMCLEEDGSFNPYTRDTFGIAVKATYAEDANGKPIMIYKQPKALSWKKSQKGCCRVALDGQSYEDELTWADHLGEDNLLQPVFRDGNMIKEDTLHDIRARLYKEGF